MDKLKKFKKQLKESQTDAENLLWYHLRNRNLGGYKFRRQQIIKNYIVDFVCLEKKLIIEVDGGQHHEQKNYDDQRTDQLTQEGFKVMRFWNHEVLKDKDDVLEAILRELAI